MGSIPTYDPAAVEAAWQARWAQNHTNEPDLDHPSRPFYNLMMFPYPSAEGLHVGNMFAFTGADIYGRFQRLHGHDVFEGGPPLTDRRLLPIRVAQDDGRVDAMAARLGVEHDA